MIKKIVFLLFFFSPLLSVAQEVTYLGSISNWSTTTVMDMEKTSDGGLVIAVDFPGSRHMSDYYGLYKINNKGNIDWKFRYGRNFSAAANYVFLDVTLDESDNIYAMLSISGLNEYNVEGHKFCRGLNLTKISPDGEIVWNKKIGESAIGEFKEVENACIKYKNGNLYVAGTYTGMLNLEDKFHFQSQEYYQCYMWMYFVGADYFVAKYDIFGNVINAISMGEDYPDVLISMEIDDYENIYFTGVSDNFPCVHSYQHITKLDSNLSLQWVNILSYVKDSPYYIPMDIHYSDNGKIYVWNNSIDNINHGVWTSNNKSPCIMEIDPTNGNILRTLNIDARLLGTNNAVIIRSFVNGFIDDFDNDLIIYSAFYTLIEDENGFHVDDYNTLLLLKIELENFSANLIKTFDGERERRFINRPGKIIVDIPYIYLVGEFGENPLDIFGTLLYQGDGSLLGTIFYSKVDMSSYITGLNTNANPNRQSKILVFPNPVSDILQIYSELEIKRVTILSIDGKPVFSITNKNFVDISNLPNGIYMIKAETNESSEVAKFLIKH